MSEADQAGEAADVGAELMRVLEEAQISTVLVVGSRRQMPQLLKIAAEVSRTAVVLLPFYPEAKSEQDAVDLEKLERIVMLQRVVMASTVVFLRRPEGDLGDGSAAVLELAESLGRDTEYVDAEIEPPPVIPKRPAGVGTGRPGTGRPETVKTTEIVVARGGRWQTQGGELVFTATDDDDV